MPRARPTTISGLVCYLVALQVRRRPWLAFAVAASAAAAIALAIAVAVAPPAGEPAARGELQAAVLSDGFVVSHAAGSGHRVIELDSDGSKRRAFAVKLGGELRVVGTTAGTTLAWQDGRKLRLRRAEDGGELGSWGSSVRQLCDGVASGDDRWAVGWLEADDTVWIVFGPVSRASDAITASQLAVPARLGRSEWCGVASAGQNLAMLWRSGDKLSILMCTKRRCGGLAGTIALDRRIPVLGFGCVRDGCLLATRDAAGVARLSYVTASGRLKWARPLAAAPHTVSILGLGDRGLAVGYTGEAGAEVVRYQPSGASVPLWRDPSSAGAPALSWSSDRLLIARYRGDTLARDVIAVPR